MGKKKNKIKKLTEEQYYAYIAGLKQNNAPFEGSVVPNPFKSVEDNDKQGE